MNPFVQVVILLVLVAEAAAEVVYQDDFSGPVGDVLNTVPEIADAGFAAEVSRNAGLDGAGRLESTDSSDAAAGYRFRIAADALTSNSVNRSIQWTATVRMPTNEWIAIGFNGEAASHFLEAGKDTGPFLRFTRTATWISPGTGTVNQMGFLNTHSGGDVVSVQVVYYVAAGTVDVLFDGNRIASNVSIPHEFPVGTSSKPVVGWAQIMLRM